MSFRSFFRSRASAAWHTAGSRAGGPVGLVYWGSRAAHFSYRIGRAFPRLGRSGMFGVAGWFGSRWGRKQWRGSSGR